MDVPSRGKCYGAVLKAGTIWAWNGEGFGRKARMHARLSAVMRRNGKEGGKARREGGGDGTGQWKVGVG